MRSHARVLFGVAALCAVLVTAATALAAETYVPDGSFSGPGSDPGQLEDPKRAAIEQSTGNLFVADKGNGRIDVFRSDGSFLASFGEAELDAPFGIAIGESAGQTVVYVSDGTVGKVQRFDSDEQSTPSFALDGSYAGPAGGAGANLIGDFAAPIALAPNGDLWVADPADDLLQRFTPSGAAVSSIDGSTSAGGAFLGLLDLAVDSQGRVYAIDADGIIENQPDGSGATGQSRVERFAPDGTHQLTLTGLSRPATVAIDPATDNVAVSADQDAVNADLPPSLHVFDPTGSELYSTRMADSARWNTTHGLAFESATPRIWAVNDSGYYNGVPYAGNAEGLHRFALVEPIAPEVTIEDATEVAYTSAKATGTVDANGSGFAFDASCRFEFVTQTHFEAEGFANATSQDCDVNPVSGSDPVSVAANLTALQDGTTFHLRLVATNLGGSVTATAASTFTTEDVATPGVTFDPVSAISGDSAHFQGEINPNAPDENANLSESAKEAFKVTYRFECTPACPGTPDPQTIEADNQPVGVSFDPQGLEPNTAYEVRLYASNGGGEVVEERSFQTDALPANVATAGANSLTDTSARLSGYVDPNNKPGTYYFEWGITPDLSDAQSLPASEDAEVSGNGWKVAAQNLTGLDPNTTYRYRLLADNGVGAPVAGEIHSFTTYPTPTPENQDCPNAAVREQQGSQYLPECRAYELVNNADLDGGLIAYGGLSPNSNRAIYATFGPAPGSKGGTTLVGSYFVADRGPNGWRAKTIEPVRAGMKYKSLVPQVGSSDLSRLVSNGFSSGPTELLRTDVSSPDFPTQLPFTGIQRAGSIRGSDDLDVLFSIYNDPHPPGLPAGLYELGTGNLFPVALLPDGTPGCDQGWGGEAYASVHVNSVDGSRIFFRASDCAGLPGLFMRSAGPGRDYASPLARTVRLDEPAPGQSETGDAFLVQATPDASLAFFISSARLRPEDTNDSSDLYRYDTASGERVCLTCNAPRAAEVVSPVVSEDGSHAYFLSARVLAAGAVAGAPNLYLAREGAPHFIAVANAFDPSPGSGDGFEPLVSPNGRAIVFSGDKDVLNDLTGTHRGDLRQLYRYDVSRNQLDCVSCPRDGSPAQGVGTFGFGTTPTGVREFVSDDGETVAFDTGTALVPGDVNGERDAYLWRPGRGAALITDGTTTRAALGLRQLTGDGSSVVFEAAARLTPEVLAERPLKQFYVARVNGGFLAPLRPASCQGDACHAGPSTPPGVASPGSAQFSGPGDPIAKPCAKGTVRRQGRCVKKKSRNQAKKNKRAGAGRKGGRK